MGYCGSEADIEKFKEGFCVILAGGISDELFGYKYTDLASSARVLSSYGESGK